METNEKKLTKKDITRSYIQWRLLAEVSHSYERYQSLSMAVTLSKPLRKLYTDDEEYRKALVRHMQFFNTEATIGAIIPGIVLSLEEDRANGAEIPDEVIASIKTGLMGPMAGIGDTLYWGTIKAICFSLAATMALSGNYAGMVFALSLIHIYMELPTEAKTVIYQLRVKDAQGQEAKKSVRVQYLLPKEDRKE